MLLTKRFLLITGFAYTAYALILASGCDQSKAPQPPPQATAPSASVGDLVNAALDKGLTVEVTDNFNEKSTGGKTSTTKQVTGKGASAVASGDQTLAKIDASSPKTNLEAGTGEGGSSDASVWAKADQTLIIRIIGALLAVLGFGGAALKFKSSPADKKAWGTLLAVGAAGALIAFMPTLLWVGVGIAGLALLVPRFFPNAYQSATAELLELIHTTPGGATPATLDKHLTNKAEAKDAATIRSQQAKDGYVAGANAQ